MQLQRQKVIGRLWAELHGSEELRLVDTTAFVPFHFQMHPYKSLLLNPALSHIQ